MRRSVHDRYLAHIGRTSPQALIDARHAAANASAEGLRDPSADYGSAERPAVIVGDVAIKPKIDGIALSRIEAIGLDADEAENRAERGRAELQRIKSKLEDCGWHPPRRLDPRAAWRRAEISRLEIQLEREHEAQRRAYASGYYPAREITHRCRSRGEQAGLRRGP
ncbi:MAG TPA: hypothetical protein VF834_12925 [Streptosporangiaceae bacterium]